MAILNHGYGFRTTWVSAGPHLDHVQEINIIGPRQPGHVKADPSIVRDRILKHLVGVNLNSPPSLNIAHYSELLSRRHVVRGQPIDAACCGKQDEGVRNKSDQSLSSFHRVLSNRTVGLT